jgi:hypothetical protein
VAVTKQVHYARIDLCLLVDYARLLKMKRHIQFAEVITPGFSGAANGILRHPFFGWLGLRPIFAQHTRIEHEALMRHARGAGIIVEIGVAEGASAVLSVKRWRKMERCT